MKKSIQEDQILRTSKEIVVKFIETGRISPSSFPDLFKNIYTTVKTTVNGDKDPLDPGAKS
jgi:predicted transcriptional regulator